MLGESLQMLPILSGLLCEDDDGRFRTLVFGFIPGSVVELPIGYTHLGVVVSGEVTISHDQRERKLYGGDFFSVVGPARLRSNGQGIVSSAQGYTGFNLFGGPLESEGKLKYINGCTDTLLVPPVRKGDPCLNHLHFPPYTVQTPHTHPSVRVNVVYRGSGVCVLPVDMRQRINLQPGYAFVMPTDNLHSFNTEATCMDVITFHPDSDTGMTDDDHPMVNRTLVEGVSASILTEIRTE